MRYDLLAHTALCRASHSTFMLECVTDQIEGLPDQVAKKHPVVIGLMFDRDYHDQSIRRIEENRLFVTVGFDKLYELIIPMEAIVSFIIPTGVTVSPKDHSTQTPPVIELIK